MGILAEGKGAKRWNVSALKSGPVRIRALLPKVVKPMNRPLMNQGVTRLHGSFRIVVNMNHLQLEELVFYFSHARPQGQSQLTPLDFFRLIEDIGLETANEYREVIAQQIAEGRHLHVIQAVLAA